MYDEAQRIGIDDWEIYHNKGLCYMYLKIYSETCRKGKPQKNAIDCFRTANQIQRHDATFMQLGKVYTLLAGDATSQSDQAEHYKMAIEVYLEALEFSPENPEILTTVGLLYLRLGENYRAFDFLGNALTHDPKNPKTILGESPLHAASSSSSS